MPFESLMGLSHRIHSGTCTSREAVEATLAAIDRAQPRLRAYATVFHDAARERADRADAELHMGLDRGPLHGVPIAIKDLVSIKGEATAAGTTVLANQISKEDATIVTRLKRAGAVIVGKTQMTEAATIAHHPSVPPPTNPWNEGYCSGFSSSGSGVAAASGLCQAAIGSDTGGSIRIPANMNGLTGLKPSWGRVSRHGVFPLVERLDTLGPLARSVADCAAVLAAIAGPDPADPTTHPRAAPNYLLSLEAGIGDAIIGYDRALIEEICDDETIATMEMAAQILAELGGRLVNITFPRPDMSQMMTLVTTGMAQAHRALYPKRPIRN
ncbi:amidase [Sphingobium sp. V4]|uniref:amidase n=1 Tax=Sphingobium sp. V4 TaxID=3038927 RepID=UPI002557FA49|nr:amidase [Sphingobium sp. V4]WIW89479.1 amidase [Sphingobium sp. V4]